MPGLVWPSLDDGAVSTEESPNDVRWLATFLLDGGAFVPPDCDVRFNDLPADDGPVDVEIRSNFAEVAGSLLPASLLMRVSLTARTLEDAVTASGRVAIGLQPIIAFTSNVAVGVPEAVSIIDSSPGVNQRAYSQWNLPSRLPAEHFLRAGRKLHPEQLFAVASALLQSPEAERLGRAISGYAVALDYWGRAKQILSLEHLYMAAEALGPAMERMSCSRTGESSEQLAAALGVDTSQGNWKFIKDAFVRRELVFHGDKATYDAARTASDGLEHGSGNLATVRDAAHEHAEKLMGHLRQTIVEALDLREPLASELVGRHAVDNATLRARLTGVWSGPPGDLAAWADPPAIHPSLSIDMKIVEVEWLEDGTYTLSPTAEVGFLAAGEVAFASTGFAFDPGLNSPRRLGLTSQPITLSVTDRTTGEIKEQVTVPPPVYGEPIKSDPNPAVD